MTIHKQESQAEDVYDKYFNKVDQDPDAIETSTGILADKPSKIKLSFTQKIKQKMLQKLEEEAKVQNF
jgi:hypothetical protein